jgi:hypothetical protein
MENNEPLAIPASAMIKQANLIISDELQGLMNESEEEFKRLRLKLNITYWIIVSLAIVMFVLGVILLFVPVIAAFNPEIDRLQSIISGGFGIADLVALFLYGPIEKIHKNMGDMSQIFLVLNSYRSQVGLRIMEMDVTNNRPSIGVAADKINSAAESSIKLIQDYFEALGPSK